MVYCLEDSHGIRDHEKHGKLQVLDVFEDELDESQSLVVVEEDVTYPNFVNNVNCFNYIPETLC